MEKRWEREVIETMGQDGMRQERKRKGKNGNGTRWKKEERREAKEWNMTELKRQGKEVTG